ncbi:MAG TPA: hypothetical protein VK157_04785 [Phycisphaerales bacterium]|nr:hypothetical protein [Phycisphaerales bacterium]
MQDFEKLGAFYLGKNYDTAAQRRTDDLLLYDAKDLVTHAICVGMTGSGKTGLCLGLLEEAAIDNIPALIIDPKGDLANLLLAFPNLAASDFRPWINESDAQTKGVTPDAFAQSQADLWRKGLAEWGQSPERIARFKQSADAVVYTPGSSAGMQLSILKSFDAPPFEIIDDPELLRDRIATTTSSLLGLAGVQSDATRGREHILVSTILQTAWMNSQNLDLAGIIQQIQSPPFQRVGVLELEAFFPSKDRFELAMALNNLLASPQFAAWSQGQPLDIGNMLYTPTGKPRLAIVSIAHLGDAERMFFVSLLLNQLLGWTRQQSGTTSLRAILYMDEIAGYVPPIANPPSKQALLTLMKQARAFGVGCVLATQNPVDIDYKGLSNAGTWFIGRLQTEQDKARLLDGLQGAMAASNKSFDRSAMDRTLSGLPKRVFVMNNVHDDGPSIFETRWCLSYLRGPLTRSQIKQLMDPVKSAAATAPTGGTGFQPIPTTPAAPSATAAPHTPAASVAAPSSPAAARPVLPPDIQQYFLPIRSSKPAGGSLRYDPAVLAFCWVHYNDNKTGVDMDNPVTMLASFRDGPVPIEWDEAQRLDFTDKDVERDPEADATFANLHPTATKAKSYADWQKKLIDTLYRSERLELLRSVTLKEVSKAGESEKDFRVRLTQTAREQRDELIEKLRAKYASKFQTLTDRIRRAESAVEAQEAQAKQAKLGSALSFGSAILGAFLGKKVVSAGNVGRAATAARSVGRATQESGDVARAEGNLEAAKQQLADLEQQFKDETDAIAAKLDPATETFETITLKPKKTDIRADAVVLVWTPTWVSASGTQRAWE